MLLTDFLALVVLACCFIQPSSACLEMVQPTAAWVLLQFEIEKIPPQIFTQAGLVEPVPLQKFPFHRYVVLTHMLGIHSSSL